MSIDSKVYVEIEERLDQMSKLKPTDEEYKATADVTLKLLDRATKMKELDIMQEKNDIELKQMVEERSARKLDHKLRFIGIAVPPAVALIGGLIFSVIERTEVHTNTPTKEFIKRALRLS